MHENYSEHKTWISILLLLLFQALGRSSFKSHLKKKKFLRMFNNFLMCIIHICSESDKQWTRNIDRLMGYRDAYWYIKDTWIGFSMTKIAKQPVAHCTFIASWSWAAWNGEIIACSLWVTYKTKLLKVTDMASDPLHIPRYF